MPRARTTHFSKNDVRERPAYPIAEAARYVRVASATLRSWTVGRRYLPAPERGSSRR